MLADKYNDRLNALPAEIWTTVARIDELKGRWTAGVRLNPQTLGRLKRSVLVTSSGASTRIEGAKLSDEEVERLIRGISIQKLKDRVAQEVQGYYELLQNVFEAWPHLPFGEGLIKHFHKELLKYVGKDELHRGDYKKKENKVNLLDESGQTLQVIFEPTPAYLTPAEMQALTEWTREALQNKRIHPLLVVGHFVVEFLKIHPFEDGNGRLSRVLTNLLLLQAGYAYIPYVSHEKLIEDNKSEYYAALRRSQLTLTRDASKTSQEDITTWLDFFLQIVLKQSLMANELLTQEQIEKWLSPRQLAVWKDLQEAEEATPGEIARRTKVPRPTVNQALRRLVSLQKVERLGQGRSTRYRKR